MTITHELSAEFPEDRAQAQERERKAARMILRQDGVTFDIIPPDSTSQN